MGWKHFTEGEREELPAFHQEPQQLCLHSGHLAPDHDRSLWLPPSPILLSDCKCLGSGQTPQQGGLSGTMNWPRFCTESDYGPAYMSDTQLSTIYFLTRSWESGYMGFSAGKANAMRSGSLATASDVLLTLAEPTGVERG